MKSFTIIVMALTLLAILGSIEKENLSAFIGYTLALSYQGMLLVALYEKKEK
jgi:hypothetical protein